MPSTTHCRHGHLREQYTYTTEKGVMVCRECRRLNQGRHYREQLQGGTGHRVVKEQASAAQR